MKGVVTIESEIKETAQIPTAASFPQFVLVRLVTFQSLSCRTENGSDSTSPPQLLGFPSWCCTTSETRAF